MFESDWLNYEINSFEYDAILEESYEMYEEDLFEEKEN